MITPKPSWLRPKEGILPKDPKVQSLLSSLGLNTVCKEARCPNRGECFGNHTATFLILGRHCTRQCTFCNVTKAPPQSLNASEAQNIAIAAKTLSLKHVVITSVTRDDLPDGGAHVFADVISQIRHLCGDNISVEVLIPDFLGNKEALDIVLSAAPDVLAHNVETVPRCYPVVRPQADYLRSLRVLESAKSKGKNLLTKSGLMLGLGETQSEVHAVMRDLRDCGCDILTLGQYLQPSKAHVDVARYITPEVFEEYRQQALSLQFGYVASAPLVRSSYHSYEAYDHLTNMQ